MKNILSLFLFLFSVGTLLGQNTVSFDLKEESGEFLTGASVVISETTNGAITNTEGIAKFDKLPDGEYEFVAYAKKELELCFPDIWAPGDGFLFNADIKLRLLLLWLHTYSYTTAFF